MLGMMSGNSINARTASLLRRPSRQHPTAQSVPAATASTVEARASQKLCHTAPSQASEVNRFA